MNNFDIMQLQAPLQALGVTLGEAFTGLKQLKRRLDDEEIQRVELTICGPIVMVQAHSLSGEIVVKKDFLWQQPQGFYTYEVEPCRQAPGNEPNQPNEVRTHVQRCMPEEAEFWGVYRRPIRQPGETGPALAEWVSDHSTQLAAEQEAQRLRNLPQ